MSPADRRELQLMHAENLLLCRDLADMSEEIGILRAALAAVLAGGAA